MKSMDLWNSRRSPVLSTRGICASSQSLASAIGIDILRQGGNAADAAVAMAAALNVTEPCSTGIGGDAFALYYDAKTKQVSCLQGNGSSPQNCTLELLEKYGFSYPLKSLDSHSIFCVTVPGAAQLWEDCVVQFGRLPLLQVLQPAINLANNGFPIGPITAEQWNKGYFQGNEAKRVFLPTERIEIGQIFRNPDLAKTFELLGSLGAKKGFYSGPVADAIIDTMKEYHGVMTHDDLLQHQTVTTDAISIVYKGVRIYQTPPPSHGIAVLIALLLIEAYEQQDPNFQHTQSIDPIDYKELYSHFDVDWLKRRDVQQLHVVIECMRCAYADALQFVADPEYFIRSNTNSEELHQKLLPSLNKSNGKLNYQQVVDALINTPQYIQARLQQISKEHTTKIVAGDLTPFLHGETVYFNVVDEEGNACSFINSNFQGFGSGITPTGCGFTLQNRGFNFTLDPQHVNCIGPRKRPYHTIIPGLSTFESDGSLHAVFGNMGGFMQPMGHVQLIRNLLDHHMNPQQACDAPRWYLKGTGETQSSQDMSNNEILLEDGFGERFDGGQDGDVSVADLLSAKGHKIGPVVTGFNRTAQYGRAQVILKHPKTGVLWAGSDPRADGCAIPL